MLAFSLSLSSLPLSFTDLQPVAAESSCWGGGKNSVSVSATPAAVDDDTSAAVKDVTFFFSLFLVTVNSATRTSDKSD